MLARQGIIASEDAEAIAAGLARIAEEYAAGAIPGDPALEDIHMATEARLAELIGPAAGRLHTARSRNDQVATDFKLWVRDAIDDADAGLAAFQRALVERAEEHAASVMPGFTHLQIAQPVTLGHHLMAYHAMTGARSRSLRFRTEAARRVSAGQRRACRHRLPDRPRHDRPRARLRMPDGQLARCGLGSRLRARLSDGRRAGRASPLAAGRGDHPLGLAAVRLRQAARCLFDGLVDHAAEAQPRRRRARARPCRADRRLPDGADNDDEGPPARLFQGYGRTTSRRYSRRTTCWA